MGMVEWSINCVCKKRHLENTAMRKEMDKEKEKENRYSSCFK